MSGYMSALSSNAASSAADGSLIARNAIVEKIRGELLAMEFERISKEELEEVRERYQSWVKNAEAEGLVRDQDERELDAMLIEERVPAELRMKAKQRFLDLVL